MVIGLAQHNNEVPRMPFLHDGGDMSQGRGNDQDVNTYEVFPR